MASNEWMWFSLYWMMGFVRKLGYVVVLCGARDIIFGVDYLIFGNE